MKTRLLLLMSAIVLVACDSKLMDGFSKLDKDVYFKIHTLGDGNEKAKSGDKIYSQLEVYGSSGKLIYSNSLKSGAMHRFDISATKSIWNKMFSVMHEGDSATFSLVGDKLNLNKLTQGKIKEYPGEITLSIKLWKLISEQEQNASKIRVVQDDLELQELRDLNNYFVENEIEPTRLLVDGIYFQKMKSGKGKRVQSGDAIWINYKGYFLNGKEFDNTYKRGQMLDFQLGKPDQVIRGFEIALSKMNEGDKVKLYLPSTFAFGEAGSSNGQVPAFTAVIYELELYQIN